MKQPTTENNNSSIHNDVEHDGFTIITIKHDNTWFGIAISDNSHVIATKQTTEQDADRTIREMVDAYRKPELTELLATYLERTQIGCTVSEIMAWHGAKRDAAHAVITRLMNMGYVRSVTEQVVVGVPGRRGRYWITDDGQIALDAYLEKCD